MKPVFVAILIALIVPHGWAQTPQQMEYDRQQREFRQAQERQQQEQQRQQQIQQENARRQQEEMNRLNRPAPGSTTPGQAPSYPTPGPGYQTPSSPSSPSAQQRQQSRGDRGLFEPPDSPQWVKLAPTTNGDVYGDASTRGRTGAIALTWAMRDFKKAQETSDGARYLSTREKLQFDCDAKIMISWLVTTFSGRMGTGQIISSTKSPKRLPVTAKDEALRKFACAARPFTR
jgi:hypothetical protein